MNDLDCEFCKQRIGRHPRRCCKKGLEDDTGKPASEIVAFTVILKPVARTAEEVKGIADAIGHLRDVATVRTLLELPEAEQVKVMMKELIAPERPKSSRWRSGSEVAR